MDESLVMQLGQNNLTFSSDYNLLTIRDLENSYGLKKINYIFCFKKLSE